MHEAGVKRRYDSRKRRAGAELTRERLLDAAAALFASHGYTGATLEAVAAKARVAVPTLYAVFGSKAALAEALIQRLKGRARVGERFAVLVAADSALVKLRISAEITEAYSRHGWAILEALRTLPPAENRLRRVWRDAEASRRRGQSLVIDALIAENRLRRGLTREKAVDVLFALSAHDTYRLYVKECGWTSEEFREWLARTTERLLVAAR